MIQFWKTKWRYGSVNFISKYHESSLRESYSEEPLPQPLTKLNLLWRFRLFSLEDILSAIKEIPLDLLRSTGHEYICTLCICNWFFLSFVSVASIILFSYFEGSCWEKIFNSWKFGKLYAEKIISKNSNFEFPEDFFMSNSKQNKTNFIISILFLNNLKDGPDLIRMTIELCMKRKNCKKRIRSGANNQSFDNINKWSLTSSLLVLVNWMSPEQ